MEDGNKANGGLKFLEPAYLSKVRAAASQEMRRELILLQSQGYPPRLAGLSERFLNAADAMRSVRAMEIRLPGAVKPEGGTLVFLAAADALGAQFMA